MNNLSLIVAMSAGGVIGRAGQLPWKLSADLQRFKRLTMGHPLIMGRRTYDSIGRPLPGRTTIVVTRQPQPACSGVLIAHTLPQAYELAKNDVEAFVIGGGEIYRQALPDVTKLYVTLVHADIEGDTFFPDIDWSQWQLVDESSHPSDERNTFATTFRVYLKGN